MLLLILLQLLPGLSTIAETNRLALSAQAAYSRGNFAAAAKDYTRMADQYGAASPAVLANMGQAYLRGKADLDATKAYTRLSVAGDAGMRSLAYNQLGVLAARQKNPSQAATYFKQALREDANNQMARINYERALHRQPDLDKPKPQDPKKPHKDKQQQQDQKKQEQEQQKQKQNQQQQQNGTQQKPQEPKPGQGGQQGQQKQDPPQPGQQMPDQPKPGSKGPDGKPEASPEGAGKDGKPDQAPEGQAASRKQLRAMQIPEQQAKMLLDAMRANEVQYLQQRRFRRQNEDKPRRGKDW